MSGVHVRVGVGKWTEGMRLERRASNETMGNGLLLPVRAPPFEARRAVVAAAAFGCGLAAFAGIFPRIEDGPIYRVLLGVTSALFAALVTNFALSTRSRLGAAACAIAVAALLGIPSTLLPLCVLMQERGGGLGLLGGLFFGAMFGVPTGALYGLPLAILAFFTHRPVSAQSHAASDRAVSRAALWLVLPMIAATTVALVDLDAKTTGLDRYDVSSVAALSLAVASTGFVAALVVFVRARERLQKRAAWLARIRAGSEAGYRIRPLRPADDVAALPRLETGSTVVEWAGDGDVYRVAAAGIPLAIVDDEAGDGETKSLYGSPLSGPRM